jgi:prophage DNA circulation protein
MIDWTATLLPASFAGQAFYVQGAHVEAGHRVARTLIPNGGHVLESFGPAPRRFEVEAYLTGDICTVQAAALLALAESQHRGPLILPDAGIAFVRLTKARRAFDKDKLGYVAVELEAVAEPAIATGGLSAGALASAIFSQAGNAAIAIGSFAASAFTLANQPSPVRDAAISAGAAPAADLTALRGMARLDPAGEAAVAPAFDAMLATLPALAVDPASFGSALGQAAVALGDAADPLALLANIRALGRPADPAAPLVTSGTSLVIAANAGVGVTLIAAARALALAEALARASFADRPQAAQIRAEATAVFDDALARIGRRGADLRGATARLKGLTGELISVRAAAIAPLITVSAPKRLPALWWAWRLYGDPSRAAELAKRANARHPASMPKVFEALAA